MHTKYSHKLGRATAASVLALSTVTIGSPIVNGATIEFKDVKASDYFYTAVTDLAAKKVVSGVGNGLFKPKDDVTRGQAAAMIARALKLDYKNAQTSRFKDVKPGHRYYGYIAALSNAGIIDGYSDGKFHSDQPVLRGSLAQMLVNAYGFTNATKLTHTFKDVEASRYYSYPIQTLVNLGIASGKTAVTFGPKDKVTRGAMAAFLYRANNVSLGKPTYIVDDVIGDKIYINSVGYKIGENVRPFIKTMNKKALFGAEIEGIFVDNTLISVSSLTINAYGEDNAYLTLDGGNSTFNGKLILNGSHIKVQNWTLNGQTIVAENPRVSLLDYRRYMNTVNTPPSGSSSGIIDWGTPTNPGDNDLNEPGGGLSGNPNNSTTYNEKLSPIKKLIDFSNSTVKNLIVEQTSSTILSSKAMNTVTIRRDVKDVEFNFDIRNLYIDTDENVTIFGKTSMDTVYKNSSYSVFFNSDSHIKLLVVDTQSGWIDLGEFVTVDKAIIPENTTPNDIFDDYKKDTDKIGVIEDNKGKEVDRDPIENGIIPDVTKPIILDVEIMPNSNDFTASLTVNETGKFYYMVLPAEAADPTAREIVNSMEGRTVNELHKNPDGTFTVSFTHSGLADVTDYKLHVVHVDDAKNFSSRYSKAFSTKDGTPPKFEAASAVGLPGGQRIQFDFTPSEKGTYYYFLRDTQNVDNTITVDDVIDNPDFTSSISQGDVDYGVTHIIREYSGIKIRPLTNYVIYAVLVDESGNKSLNVTTVRTRTTELDNEAPFVSGATQGTLQKLEPVNTAGGMNQFYMYFNERLIKETAEDINNYDLSGTGIVNVPGQTTIKPSKVEYSNFGPTGSRVLISIPSLSGFVHRDTLRVTVSKNVLDLAENPFEHLDNAPAGITPRNYAEYQHEDAYYPELQITNVERDQMNPKSKVYYNASKAGSIYYMVIPESINLDERGITPEDFEAEFEGRPTAKFNGDDAGTKIYLEGNTPQSLRAPLIAEIGNANFDYDYSTLQPSSYESYRIYMVLKDRSGRLSSIMSEVLIADKEPPKIIDYDVRSKTNADDRAVITVNAENESGLVYYGYAEKYILNSDGKYVLNPALYDGSAHRIFGTNMMQNNAQRKAHFMANVPRVKTETLRKGPLNEFEITGLKKHTEYVFYVAVEDTFGNFTVNYIDQSNNAKPMVRELYTDGTKPHIVNNVVYRNYDNSFTVTFSEALGKTYVDGALVKTTLDQKAMTPTSLQDLFVITDAFNEDVTHQYELKGYTVGTSMASESKLTFGIVDSANTSADRTINISMKDSVKDQFVNANYGNTFALDDIGKYIHRNLDIKFAEISLEPYTNDQRLRVIFDLIGTMTTFDATEKLNYYYQSYSKEEQQSVIESISAQTIIESIKNPSNTISTLARGYGDMSATQPRTAVTLQNDVKFFVNDFVVIAIEDMYGNRTVIHTRVPAPATN